MVLYLGNMHTNIIFFCLHMLFLRCFMPKWTFRLRRTRDIRPLLGRDLETEDFVCLWPFHPTWEDNVNFRLWKWGIHYHRISAMEEDEWEDASEDGEESVESEPQEIDFCTLGMFIIGMWDLSWYEGSPYASTYMRCGVSLVSWGLLSQLMLCWNHNFLSHVTEDSDFGSSDWR